MSASDARLRKVSADEAIARIRAARETTPGMTREKWRAGIPWSNAEIADAIDQAADIVVPYNRERLREVAAYLRSSGRLSSRMLRVALPILVTTCGLCDRRALYRIGKVGRCRVHRDVGEAFKDESNREIARASAIIYKDAREYDAQDIKRERFRLTKRRRR